VWLGVTWLVLAAATAAVLALTQTNAILGVEPGQSTGDFTADLGAVGTGMVPFNIGLALMAPIIVTLVVVLLVRARRWPLAAAVAGPVAGPFVIAVVFMSGADTAGISRLQSYYVLKPLDAVFLATATLVIALLAVVGARALDGLPRVSRGLGVAVGAATLVGMLGYVGVLTQLGDGYAAAPGVQAGADRTRGIEDSLVGEAIIRGQQAALPYPDRSTLLFDGSGTLPNLWVASLHGVLSKADQRFYRGLPAFPYDASTLGYVDLALGVNPQLELAVLWFRPTSGELLEAYTAARNDDRVLAVRVEMPPNDLCPECAP
jgi:hypothetical protein